MPSLKELQASFTRSAFGEAEAAFVSAIEGGGKLTSAQAVEVYRGGYPARISEALGETFEACWRVLGDEDFLAACAEYARKTPSAVYNLSDYGASFPAFLLERFRADAPFIGDLAALEWSFKELFHAAPHPVLAPAELAAAVKENSVLLFGSAVTLSSFKHAVHGLWKRDRSDATPLSPSDWEGPQDVLLYKSGGSAVFSRVLAAPEAAALRALIGGRSLADALAASSALDEAATRELFSFISSSGIVTGVRP